MNIFSVLLSCTPGSVSVFTFFDVLLICVGAEALPLSSSPFSALAKSSKL